MQCVPERCGAWLFWHRAPDTSLWVGLHDGGGMGMEGIVAGSLVGDRQGGGIVIRQAYLPGFWA